jgi:outer membrane immunogenic protein
LYNLTLTLFMKKIAFLSIALLASVVTSYSQVDIGGGLAFGTNSGAVNAGATGLFFEGEFYLSDKFSISPDAIVYIVSDIATQSRGFWEVNANVNYYFFSDWTLKFYGVGGLNLSTATWKVDGFPRQTNSEIGFNVGAGVNWDINANITPFSEVKFTLGNYDQAVIKAGIKYRLK